MHTKNATKKTFTGLAVLISLLFAGCSNDHDAELEAENSATVKRCIDTGGMPVRVGKIARFVNCIYPHNNNSEGK